MHTRILIGVAAWLLGAATATGGSLLAVSLLGQGITGTGGLLLTPDGVHRALASEAADASAAAATAPPGSPGGTRAGDGTVVPAPATVAASPAPPSPAGSASPVPAGDGAPSATVLTSRGGDVVASCLSAGVYLDSWSPLSGYEVGDVSRGPAATARVTFGSAAGTVTMLVSCPAGVPSAATYFGSGAHGDE